MLSFPSGLSNSVRLNRGQLLSCPPFSCTLNVLLYSVRIKALKLGGWLGKYDTNDLLSYLCFCMLHIMLASCCAVHYITTYVISSGRLHKSDLWVQPLWKKFKLLSKEVAGSDTRGLGSPQTLPKVLRDFHGRWKKPSSVPTAHYVEWEKIVILPVFWVINQFWFQLIQQFWMKLLDLMDLH